MKTIFVGGVHGVGKTTACKIALKINDFDLYLASELLSSGKREGKNSPEEVNGFEENQEIIVNQFLKRRGNKADRMAVIDGHFALLEPDEKIRDVKPPIFKNMSISHLICLYDDVDSILKRLHLRDGRVLDTLLIESLQEREMENAKLISIECNVPLYYVKADDINNFLKLINDVSIC